MTKGNLQVSRRDMLRYGASLAAVSALAPFEKSLAHTLQPATKPNIVFVLMDNLGYGEPGCYGGGELRGAPKLAGALIPRDRAIDGVDQTDFFLGKPKSNREGFPVFVADRMEAVKWRNYKMAFYEEERDWWSAPAKLGVPKIYDLYTDPKEEYPATLTPNGWVAGPMMKIVGDFEASLKKYPPIAPGTFDPYRPQTE